MKLQSCKFKRAEDSDWEFGAAKVTAFGLYDVEWIIDQNGNKIGRECWTYEFLPGGHPGCADLRCLEA